MKNFKEKLSELGIEQKDFAEVIGIKYSSFRTLTTKNKLNESSPSWIKAFIFGLKIGQRGNEKADRDI